MSIRILPNAFSSAVMESKDPSGNSVFPMSEAWYRVFVDLLSSWTAYTPTYTGFSAAPSNTGHYHVIGKTCRVNITDSLSGTSNATTFTVTLPFTSASYDQVIPLMSGKDNSAYAAIGGTISANTNVLTLTLSGSSSGFTNVGTKGCNLNFTYETS